MNGLIEKVRAAELAIDEVRRAFGAPGDYGYETREGHALYALYRARAELGALLNDLGLESAT